MKWNEMKRKKIIIKKKRETTWFPTIHIVIIMMITMIYQFLCGCGCVYATIVCFQNSFNLIFCFFIFVSWFPLLAHTHTHTFVLFLESFFLLIQSVFFLGSFCFCSHILTTGRLLFAAVIFFCIIDWLMHFCFWNGIFFNSVNFSITFVFIFWWKKNKFCWLKKKWKTTIPESVQSI